MPLSSKDYKAILELIDLCYSIPDRNLMYKALCERLQRIVPFSTSAFIPVDPQTESPSFQRFSTFNLPDKIIPQFCSYYVQLHPMAKKGIPFFINHPSKITDIISPAELAETEYSRDFQSQACCFYEMGFTTMGSQGDPIGMLGFHRPRQDKDFTDRDKEIIGILAPHLSRAIHNINLLETITSSQGIGLIVIGQDGIPPFINDEAKRALNGRPISSIPDPGFSIEPIFFKSEAGTYRVRTMPPAYSRKEKVIILEPIPTEYDIMPRLTEFGLSKREQEIAMLVVRGCSNREIAEKLYIQEQTVKDHLRHIFEKMKVRSRYELIAKAMVINHSFTK